MNKQEAIDKIKNIGTLKINDTVLHQQIDMVVKNQVLDIISQIDESQKVVVPQFVADWYEEHKDNFEFNVQCLCVLNCEPVRKIDTWFDSDDNKPIETLVLMHKFGYEVKKEKLYTVKFSNEDFGKIYIGIFKKFNKLGISSLPLNDDEIKSWFTEDELKRFKFWDNPAFEINEVEEVSRLTDGAWNTLAELNETEVDE